jgi:hypothetical protein
LFDQNALQKHALTDFFVPDENNTLQLPPGNFFALVGTGQSAGNPDLLNPYLDIMNGPFAGSTIISHSIKPKPRLNRTFSRAWTSMHHSNSAN